MNELSINQSIKQFNFEDPKCVKNKAVRRNRIEISKDQISFGIEDPATPRPLQDEIKLTERPRLDKYLLQKRSFC